ncbi:MAG: hypothetical protein AB9903_03940 [Vulcanimicrobiota bacterium]
MTSEETKRKNLEEFKKKHSTDKNSSEWKEYSEGLLEFDSHFPKGTPYFASNIESANSEDQIIKTA